MVSRILAVAQDPGGADNLVPVLQLLNTERGYNVYIIAHNHARQVFDTVGLPFVAFSDLINTGDRQSTAERVTAQGRWNLVLTATSLNAGVERYFIRAAKKLGVPSLSLIDSWTNYRLRFVESRTEPLNMNVLPDVIGVANEFSADQMELEGFPRSILRVVGHPALDRFILIARQKENGERRALRKRFGVQLGVPILVFFSQGISTLYGGPGSPDYQGYTEQDALNALLSALPQLPGSPQLIVKSHPKESAAKYQHIDGDLCHFLYDYDADNLVLGADVVIGMTSITLLKAFLIGRGVVSLQPNLIAEDQCVLTRMGYITTVSDTSRLVDVLVAALAAVERSPLSNCNGQFADGHAVDRITCLIRELVQHQT
jgi:hypothetical protein